MAQSDLIELFGRKQAIKLNSDSLCTSLRVYLDACSKHTDAKPGYLLTAILPFMSANVGNRLYMYNNSSMIYPNIWACMVGPSSVARKSTALNYAGYTLEKYEESLLDKTAAEYERDTLVLTGTTMSKLMSFLSVNATRLFVHHEISGWLTEMGKHWNAGYRQVITELFDGINRTMSNQDRTEKIINPALSIAAASTEGWLYKNVLDTSDQMSGFMQRMIFYVVKQIPIEDINFEHKAGAELRDLLNGYDARYYVHWRSLPGQHCLKLSQEAVDHKNKIYRKEFLKYYKLGNDNLMSYFTRIFDNYLFKFCILIWLLDIHPDDIPLMHDAGTWADYVDGVPVDLKQFK